MPNYDFKSLSSYDFALLARDLLQKELKVRLESFSAGPDSGIDFRDDHAGASLVVQCKHYAESGFSALTSLLRRKERPKIDKLSPARYILVTSVSLTPERKDEIKEIIGRNCRSVGDVYGREDLNNLLGRHAEIERQHFKLWLTSEPVLQRVLHAGIFEESAGHLARVRARLCRYVQNASFDRARHLLSKSHYCIIAGIPGIGKTTLAEVLLADLVDRQGFEAFRITHGLEEIRNVKDPKRKQVFYFDDFLGTTGLESFDRNEDQRLIELMEDVCSNPNWRFILTTREYVLNAAKFRSEAFAHPRINLTLCIVKLDDYTRPIRARILYNHIYFSELPIAHKLALLRGRAYEKIVNHRNYSPRIVEYMTDAGHASAISPSLYLTEFADNLEYPVRIWDHAFKRKISEPARHVLLALVTLPDQTLLADLETAFWKFYVHRQKRYGFSTRSGDWSDALKELDGNFITTQKVGQDLAISFHNPSVRDFLEDFLFKADGDVLDLIRGAHFYEQYVSLWRGRGGIRYPGVTLHLDEFLNQLRSNMFGPTATAWRRVNSQGEVMGLVHSDISHERRAQFAVQLVEELKGLEADRFLEDVTQALKELWRAGHADRPDLAQLLRSLTERGLRHDGEVFLAAKQCLSREIKEADDYRGFAIFASTYPNELTQVELDQVRSEFLAFAADYSDRWDDDSDWLRQMAADLEFVAERLEVDVSKFTDPLEARASEIEAEQASKEPDSEDDDWRSHAKNYGDEITEMFESLREELEN